MAIPVSSQQDFQKIPLLNIVVESSSSAPASPSNGQLYYNTADNRAYVREGGAWVLISQTGALLTTTNFGGDVSGTYNNLQIGTGAVGAAEIADGTITDTEIATANKDGAANTPSMRTLGTGAAQAAAGNDARFTDSRTPSGSAGGDLAGTYPNPTISTTAANTIRDGWKKIVRAATTANITLSGTQTIDGVSVIAGDRVLVKNQSTTSANGVYDVAAGAWTRSADFDTAAEAAAAVVMVAEGTNNGGNKYATSFKSTDTLGSTSLSWSQIPTLGSPSTFTQKTIALGSNTITGTAAEFNTAVTDNDFVFTDDSRLTNSRTPSGSAGGDLTGTYPNPTIATNAVTFAKFQQIATDRLLGRDTAATGNVEELTVGGGIEFTGSGGIQRSAISGDVTISAGSGTAAITAGAVVIGDLNSALTLDSLATSRPATAAITANSQKITNLGTPTADTDAATKAYVDAARSGLDVKQSVRVASTANVTVTYAATGGTSTRGQITAAPNTLDGVSLAANDRILLKDQSTGAQNGIWVVTTLGTGANGVWDRATDFDADAEVTSGAFTFVTEGTAHSDSGWTLTTNDPIVIGGASGTALTFAQFSGAGQITAGAGLTKTGNTLDVVGTTDRITVNADSIDIASSYVGQTSITTLGTITTGTWSATTIAANKGGTGFSSYTIGDLLYADSNTTLAKLPIGASGTYLKSNGSGAAPSWATPAGTVAKYSATLGALSAGVETTITHSLGTEDVQVTFRAASDPKAYTILAWRVIDSNSVGVTSDVAYTASTLRVVVVG